MYVIIQWTEPKFRVIVTWYIDIKSSKMLENKISVIFPKFQILITLRCIVIKVSIQSKINVAKLINLSRLLYHKYYDINRVHVLHDIRSFKIQSII